MYCEAKTSEICHEMKTANRADDDDDDDDDDDARLCSLAE